MRKLLSLGVLALLLSVCGGCESVPPFTGVGPSPAIGVGVNSAPNLTRGSTAQVTIIVARLAGFTGTIDLSAEGLPAGVTAAFVPATVPTTATTSTLTLTATTTAALGTVIATVRAHATGLTDATVQLVIGVNP